jgi:tetratricopeptide (TPR) repeat protein
VTRSAGLFAATLALTLAAGAEPVAVAPPAFSRAEYFELIRRYARGERAEAVAGLGAWSERNLARQLASVEEAARAAERCPACPNVLADLPLRAAVMLHWDRDRADQPSPEGVELQRQCPGPLARLAGRLARVLARRPATADFARRFFRMVVTSCQWDACFDAAERWAGEAIEIFPRDAELLLARGSVREESATLGTRTPQVTDAASAESLAAGAREAGLQKARRDLEDTLAIDAGLGLARVRLGRVLWRLEEPEPARHQLETALSSLRDVDHAYLARLFLGRIQQDTGRLEEAISEPARRRPPSECAVRRYSALERAAARGRPGGGAARPAPGSAPRGSTSGARSLLGLPGRQRGGPHGPARGAAPGVPGVSRGRRALVALAFAVLARTGHAQSPQKPIEFRSQVAAVNVDAFVTGRQPAGLRA